MCDCNTIYIYSGGSMQGDFDELVEKWGSKEAVFAWLLDNYDDDWCLVKSQLKDWGFESLTTDNGMEFLISQLPCPISQ